MYMDAKPIKYTIGSYNIYIINMPSRNVYVGGFIDNGYIHENTKTCGINHLLEHILMNAWNKCGSESCFRYWDKRPVHMNASTHTTFVDYFINGLHSEMLEMINYIFKIVTMPEISDKTVNDEKKAVESELHNLINRPVMPLIHKMNQVLYKRKAIVNSSDYHLQISNLKDITKKDIIQYYNKKYNAKNTSFYISGSFTTQHIKQILGIFRDIVKPIKVSNNTIVYYNDVFTYNTKIIHHPNVSAKNTEFVISVPLLPDYKKYKHYQTILTVIQNISNIQLFDLLRTQHKLIYGITLTFDIYYYGVELNIIGSCIDKNILPVLSEIMKWLHNFRTVEFTQTEIKQSVGKVLLQLNDTKITPSYICKYYEQQIHLQGQESYTRLYSIREQFTSIKNTKLEDIQKIQRCVDINNVVVGYTSKTNSKITLAKILP